MCVVLLSNRNEDRKIALLNLLSVGGLLGIFSMWRKIRKSRWNLCQAVEVTASSHTLPVLIKHAGVTAVTLPLQKRKQLEHGKRKLTLACVRLLSNVSCSFWPWKRRRHVWKWVSKPASLCSVDAGRRTFLYLYVHFAEGCGRDPEIKVNMLGRICKPLDLPQFCL